MKLEIGKQGSGLRSCFTRKRMSESSYKYIKGSKFREVSLDL